MNTIIEKIRAEVERRIKSWQTRGEHSPEGQGKDTCVSRVTELTDLLNFIETCKEQPVCEELGREMDRFFTSKEYAEAEKAGFGEAHAARHFAQWQKEQMMKEAVEVRVQTSPLNGPLGISAYCCNFPSKHPFYRCKAGDKVKLIIIKED